MSRGIKSGSGLEHMEEVGAWTHNNCGICASSGVKHSHIKDLGTIVFMWRCRACPMEVPIEVSGDWAAWFQGDRLGLAYVQIVIDKTLK